MRKYLLISLLLIPFSAGAQSEESTPRDNNFFGQDFVNENERAAEPNEEEEEPQFKRRELPSQSVAGSHAVKKGFERPQPSPSSQWNQSPTYQGYPNRKPPQGVFESFEADYSLRERESGR